MMDAKPNDKFEKNILKELGFKDYVLVMKIVREINLSLYSYFSLG